MPCLVIVFDVLASKIVVSVPLELVCSRNFLASHWAYFALGIMCRLNGCMICPV